MAKASKLFLKLLVICYIVSACSSPKVTTAEIKPYTPVSQSLFDTIARMDSILFDAFNTRKLDVFQAIFSTDLEFYHDKGGLSRYEQSIENTTSLFKRTDTLRRRHMPGTMEVYPIKDYGAVQIGSHQFCHQENGKNDCGIFKFIHLWKRHPDGWKITRVISYDH
jgi:hypothetical protein